MNLHDFEWQMDPVIVARGQAYFESGHIVSLVTMGNGEFKARVEGTEVYIDPGQNPGPLSTPFSHARRTVGIVNQN